jgi:hypothetical protein
VAAATLLGLLGAGAATPTAAHACDASCLLSGTSSDGSTVFFATTAQMAANDTDSNQDVYERSGGTTTLVSTNTAGTANGAFTANFSGASSDGSTVFFQTDEQLAATDTDSNFDIYERSGGITTQVSTNTAGTANDAVNPFFGAASRDGSKVFFQTTEQMAANDTDSDQDVFERSGGTTTLVSTDTAGTANGANVALFVRASSDGSKVFFQTDEQLAATDTDSSSDIYERSGGMTTQVSTNTAGTANGAFAPNFRGISSDGSAVIFETNEQLAASDHDSAQDTYARSGGATRLVDATGSTSANFAGVSGDGSKVFFTTVGSLDPGDGDGGSTDLYESSGGTTTWVSTNNAGVASGAANVDGFPTINAFLASGDASRVFFRTAEALTRSDTDSTPDIYERHAGITTQVSTDIPAPLAPGFTATNPASSADNNSPIISGSAVAGSTVKLYANSDCTGTPVAIGTAASFASPGIAVAVPDNSTTTFHATATDPTIDLISNCSTSSITYVEDSTTPTPTPPDNPGQNPPDITPPETNIDSAKVNQASRKASIKFSSSEPGSGFLCKLDKHPLAACTSPKTYKHLNDPGRHTFKVQAVDPAGNIDSSPAKTMFRIDRPDRLH